LLGACEVSVPMAAVAAGGLVLATVYSLWLIYRTFHGEAREAWRMQDLSVREMAVFVVLIAAIVWLGLFPQPVLSTAGGAIDGLFKMAPATAKHGAPVCIRGGLAAAGTAAGGAVGAGSATTVAVPATAKHGVGMPPGAEEVRDTEDHGHAAARGRATRRLLTIPHFASGGAP
ncbi:MAG: hypothetical protein NTU94_11720, partial [Planctomycetota bacterium]|nr:hypothetical protein [Planctomycetota bacterium]